MRTHRLGPVRNREVSSRPGEMDPSPEDVDLIVNMHSLGREPMVKHISNAKIAINKLERNYMRTTLQTIMRFFFAGSLDERS